MACDTGIIIRDPEILSGTPVFRGTRVPFKNLLDYLEGGYSLDEFLEQFPLFSAKMPLRHLNKRKNR